jgi:hypothetical protein
MTVSWVEQLKSLFRRSDEPSATRRLDGRSKELLAASIKMLPYEERGWITLEEAAVLFSPPEDEYAFREIDEGKRNLASFVAKETYCCRFAFIEGRLYFIRTASNPSEMRGVGSIAYEPIRRMVDQVSNCALKARRVVGSFSQKK